MRNRIFVIILAVIIGITAFPMGTHAAEYQGTSTEIQQILEYERGLTNTQSLQDYVDVGLVPYAGISPTEWIVISLYRFSGGLDYSSYFTGLEAYLSQNNTLKATDYERIALVKASFGMDKEWVEEVIDTYTGSFGIMSLIYGLQLKNSRVYDTQKSGSSIVEEILKLQKSDGGFSISGNYGDSDVTAMALQALAPYVADYPEQINQAITRLSNLQKSDGAYASMGLENAESTAQVMIALTALGIDYRKDARFIKNGNTLMDGLMIFSNGDGSYCHTLGAGADQIATVQVLNAMVAQWHFEKTGKFIYLFEEQSFTTPETTMGQETTTEKELTEETTGIVEDTSAESVGDTQTQETQTQETLQAETTRREEGTETETSTAETTTEERNSSDNTENGITGTTIKAILLGVLGTLWVGYGTYVLIAGKKKNPFHLMVLLAGGILFVYLACAQFQSREEHYQEVSQGDVTTYLSVQGYSDTILPQTKVMIREGDSAFDQLYQALTQAKINLDYTGSELMSTLYVKSIQNLGEFDHGSTSGWIYKVNGESPKISAGSYLLKKGDVVEWIYTTGGDGT